MSNHPSFDFCLLKIIHKNPFTQPSLIGDESTRLIHPVLSAHVGNTIFNPSVEIHIVLRVELQSRGLKKKRARAAVRRPKLIKFLQRHRNERLIHLHVKSHDFHDHSSDSRFFEGQILIFYKEIMVKS
jgi:hypothetical protein